MEPPLHDAYYVVAHWQYAIQMLATLFVVWFLWRWMMPGFGAAGRWIGRGVLFAVSAGTLMTLLPTLDVAVGRSLDDQIARFALMNSIAMVGGLLVGLSVLSTLVALGIVAVKRLRHR